MTLFDVGPASRVMSAADRERWRRLLRATRGSEKAFQRVLVKFMRSRGWHVTHNYTTKINGQWITSTSSPGVPDLMAVRADRLVFLELKKNAREKRLGRKPTQQRWVDELAIVGAANPGVEAFFCSPEDAAVLIEMLA